MASADQLKALLKAYSEGNDLHFYSVAMQIAAHEAKLGHGKLAEDLRSLIDKAKKRHGSGSKQSISVSRPRGDLGELLTVSYPRYRFGNIILKEHLASQLKRVILEQRHSAEILRHGLSPRRKLLLVGPPGTGKTMSASVLAGELGFPLCQVRLDGLITKYMGETAAKLRLIFDATDHTRGVYFFDEFDSIGSHRGMTNDVGEIRRVLNSFLLMIEQDTSHSLIIAATNHPDILDHALFRRFDDVLHYTLPDKAQTVALLKAKLSHVITTTIDWERLADIAVELSYAEVARAGEEAMKNVLIDKEKHITEAEIANMLIERKELKERLQRIG